MLLYRCLITLLTPVLLVALFIRVLRKVESLQDFRERLGMWKNLPSGDVIWIHGASNGELSAARPLIDGLCTQNPDARLLVTCNSISAKNMVRAWGRSQLNVYLAPIDLGWVYGRLLRKLSLRTFILIEADFWPNRMRAIAAARAPIALIGGRISKSSSRTWGRFSKLSMEIFQTFDLICPQDQESAMRLSKLGASDSAFGAEISLKSLFQAKPYIADDESRLSVWLAASTHEGEDETLLRAHLEALKSDPTLRMILAPRHPKRGANLAKLAEMLGLSVTQRSLGAEFDSSSQVYIADTLGEMAQWYSLAGTCFVGGSLVAKGGHTPFEPVVYDCAILHGPHLENFAVPYAALAKHEAAMMCTIPEEIACNVISLRNLEASNKMRSAAHVALPQIDTLDVVLTTLSQMSKN